MIQFHAQPPDRFADLIVSLATNAIQIDIASAYVKRSGLSLLCDALRTPRKVRLITTVHGSVSDLQALLQAEAEATGRVEARVCTTTNLFHPKIYTISMREVVHVIIGSANLSAGGFADNCEAVVHIEGSRDDPFIADVNSYFENLWISHAMPVSRYLAEHPEYGVAASPLEPALTPRQREVLATKMPDTRLSFRQRVGRSVMLRCQITVPQKFREAILESGFCRRHSKRRVELCLWSGVEAPGIIYHSTNDTTDYCQIYVQNPSEHRDVLQLLSQQQVVQVEIDLENGVISISPVST